MNNKGIASYLGIAICLNIAISCSTSTPKTEVESVDIPTVTFELLGSDQKLTDAFSKVSFIQLELTEDCIVGDIQKIEDINDTLVILTNSQEIFAFDKKDGKFLHQIGSVGEGPDEYLEAIDMFYDETSNSINIFDRYRSFITSYSIDGKHLGTRKLEVPTQYARCATITTD